MQYFLYLKFLSTIYIWFDFISLYITVNAVECRHEAAHPGMMYGEL